MNILNVASPTALVGRDAPDGIERIIASIDHALTQAGHTSVVIAAPGSSIDGLLLEVPVTSGQAFEQRALMAQTLTGAVIAETLSAMHVDVVHFHGFDMLSYLPETHVPMLATLHLPISWYAPEVFRRNLHLTCVSFDQRTSLPDSVRNRDHVGLIENGVDTALFAPMHHKHDYVAVLGSVTPERGFHLALEAARLARTPCLLAGDISPHPVHQHYFRDSIVPRLDSERIFVGPLMGLKRRAFLARARALVVPSLVEATSSVAAMEALACGTPVVAMRRGALPGIIEHGTTGFLVDGFLELAEALQRLDTLSLEACREAALARFDVRNTTDRYLEMYARLASIRAPSLPAATAVARKS